MENNTLLYYQNNSLSLVDRYESADVSEVQQLLLQTFHTNGKLLEIGCGSGRDASFMIKNNYNVFAIDGSENMIREAKKNHPNLSNNLLHRVLPNELTFDEKFDGIYSIATLMHLTKNDVDETISKIYNLLKGNGFFLMSVSLFRDDVDKNGFDEKGRFFLILTKNEWLSICRNAGFKISNVKTNKDGLSRENIEWLTLVAEK